MVIHKKLNSKHHTIVITNGSILAMSPKLLFGFVCLFCSVLVTVANPSETNPLNETLNITFVRLNETDHSNENITVYVAHYFPDIECRIYRYKNQSKIDCVHMELFNARRIIVTEFFLWLIISATIFFVCCS